MIFQIRHRIQYSYERPVILEPLTVRLRPRADGLQQVFDWDCELSPQPVASTATLDVFNNAALQATFAGLHDALVIDVKTTVETLLVNPFDFLALDPQVINLPVSYDPRLSRGLSPYLQRAGIDARIDEWVGQIAQETQRQTQPFLLQLTESMSRDFASVVRGVGPPNSPSHTFDTRVGSCRDLAVLFMDACRSQGLAARFVSGYFYERNRTSSSELHAWAEVFVPGGGWRGYDPSLGVAVAADHVPVASGPESDWAVPTEGCYRGLGAASRMDYEVIMSPIETVAG